MSVRNRLASSAWTSMIVLAFAGTAAADTPSPQQARPRTTAGTVADRVQPHRIPLDGKKIAQAPTVKVTCEVIEISATTGPNPSTDPKLKAMEKKLAKQPWSFNQYRLLSQDQKVLEKGKVESLKLKSGSGTAMLVETVDKSKVRLNVSEDHDGKRVINSTSTIAAGDWLIVGHPVPPNKDGHLLAMSCK
ncbi:MAG: hypothetical protein H0T89_20845 [Deltaproteobacteria bacterium]|nr:hypothetical protein [Deltaproteobacteria bacterium]MDQ3297280.1 hypothetical protein [Myxococcota bacterium]